MVKKYKIRNSTTKTYIVTYRKKTGWDFEIFNTLKRAEAFGKKKSPIFIIYTSNKFSSFVKD